MLSTSSNHSRPNSQRWGHFQYMAIVATLILGSAVFLFSRPNTASAAINPEITNTQVGQEVIQRVLPVSEKKTVTRAEPADTDAPELAAPTGMDHPLSPTAGSTAVSRQALPRQLDANPLSKRIELDLSQQRLYAIQDGQVVYSVLISSGLTYATPTGNFRIRKRVYNEYMSDGSTYFLGNVLYTQYFTGVHAFHYAWWHHNWGHPMSHGCINMSLESSHWLWDWASVGTPVSIHQ